MADRPASRFARSAIGGLALGLVAAAAILGVKAILSMQVDCTNIMPEECAFNRQIGDELARMQGLIAVGCAAVGIGLGLMLRREEKGHGEAP